MAKLGKIIAMRATKLDANGKPTGEAVLLYSEDHGIAVETWTVPPDSDVRPSQAAYAVAGMRPRFAPQCADHCQNAVDLGCWPEAQCGDGCAYLDHPDNV